MSEFEETFQRIKTHKGVRGVIVCTTSNSIIRTSMEANESKKWCQFVSDQLEAVNKSFKSMIAEDDNINFIRMRTNKYEVMIAPDKEFILIIVQDPSNA